MSTDAWFREFERQETMREERIDHIRAQMQERDGPKPPRYEAQPLPLAEASIVHVFGVLDTFTQKWVEDERHSSKARAAVAAGRMNAAYIRATAP